MLSATTGKPYCAKRAGSPLALRTILAQAGRRRSSTRSRMVFPPMRIIALSPPPMRRARPPASTRPSVDGISVFMHGRLAAVLGTLVSDIGEVLVEHDAILTGERDEAFAARPSDQGEVRLAGELDAPGGEAR